MANTQISNKKLKAIVFTDIVDFTKLSAEDEQHALNLIDKQREIVKPIVEKHNGEWLKEIGDGLLFSFDSSLDAVNCSIEIQQSLKDIDDFKIRIGIHQGDIFVKDGDVFGDDVNIASRVESFAPEGGISLSDKVHKDISGVSDIKTSFIGHRKLKGVEQETKIRCITSNELPRHRKQIVPLIIGYYTIILGGLNAFLIFALIIYSAFIGFKLHFMWMCAFIIDFTLIFIGYSCLSYVRGVSIKAQRLFVYLGYFIIISTILSALAMKQGLLFYLPPPETMLPF
jgi:class 3 adenylate cyclase